MRDFSHNLDVSASFAGNIVHPWFVELTLLKGFATR